MSRQTKPDYTQQLLATQRFIKRYYVLISVLFFAGLAGSLIIYTNSLVAMPAESGQVQQKVQATSTPRISESTADIIRSLDSQNITIQPDINTDRDNPFDE